MDEDERALEGVEPGLQFGGCNVVADEVELGAVGAVGAVAEVDDPDWDRGGGIEILDPALDELLVGRFGGARADGYEFGSGLFGEGAPGGGGFGEAFGVGFFAGSSE